jgi:Family of unknown function (DUF6441)
VKFTVQCPDFGKALAETEKDIDRAVTSGMREAADGLKQNLREDVVAAGLGERLSRTWRGKTFPEVGESAETAAYVWSHAPKIVDAFDRGVLIRSARGLFLAIPTAAGKRWGELDINGEMPVFSIYTSTSNLCYGLFSNFSRPSFETTYRRMSARWLLSPTLRAESSSSASTNPRVIVETPPADIAD